MADSEYKVKIVVTTDDKTSGPAKAAAKGLGVLKKAAKDVRLAETLGKSSDLARAALSNLDQSLASGAISLDTYKAAVGKVQQSFGLVTPESEKAARTLQKLDSQLAKGEITADQYESELKQVAKALDGVEKESQEAGKASKFIEGAIQGVGQAVGGMAMSVLQQLPQITIELVKMGAAAERQAATLDNLAQSSGTTGDAIISAIQRASDYTIDRTTAMAAANRAMVMDVAKSPVEFERLTKVAVALGRAMGVDAATSIDDFVTASARQSQMIADNLGLTVSAGKAAERFAEANNIAADSMTDAQKKQAFLNMMLEEGEKKMLELGDGTLDTAGKIEQAQSAWSDVKLAVSEAASAFADATGLLERGVAGIREYAAQVELFATAMQMLRDGASLKDVMSLKIIDEASEKYGHLSGEIDRYAFTLEQSAEIGRFNRSEVEQQISATQEMTAVQGMATRKLEERSAAQDELAQSAFGMSEGVSSSAIEMARNVIESADKAKQATDELAAAMDITVQLNLSMGFTRQAESEKEAAARIAADKEKIESEHQEKLSAIQAKGASRAVRLDVASEQEKLATRQFAMDQAQLKVDEMTGKERESAQNAKQQALVVATQKYAEQQKLLEDYAAGRLVIAGQNTDALIAEEQRRYQEALKIQAAEEAKQAKDQKKAQGQMLIQAVDTWASQEDLPPEMTKKVAEMRVNIAEEYGMVAEGSAALVADILGELDAWASGAKVTTGELVGYFGDVISATDDTQARLLNLTANEYVIKVRWEQMNLPAGVDPDVVAFQHGGSFMVGEAGAEMVTVQPVGRGGDSIYNDTFNVYDGNSMAAVQENRRRQRRGGIARTM